MADFDPREVTRIMEERVSSWSSADTAAKELMKLTGLNYDVAKAFCSRLTSKGGSNYKAAIRGYKKGEFPKKKTP
jgi:hypothetical protein